MSKPILDLETFEKVQVVEKPTDAKTTEEQETATEEEESSDEESEEDEEAEESESEEESGEEQESENGEEEEAGEDEKEESDEDGPVSVDDYIKDKYSQKYDIKSETELEEVLGKLDSVDELIAENEKLTAELKQKSDKPKFKSASQEKMWEMFKDIDPAQFKDRTASVFRIMAIDAEKDNGRTLLEEQFIFENPDLSRDKAIKKFNFEYNKQFTVPARTEFDSDEEYNDAKEMAEINLESSVNKARKFIKTKQAELKVEATQQDDNQPKENPKVSSAIKENVSELDAKIKGFNELTWINSDNKEETFSYKFTKEQIKAIDTAAREWVGSPSNYSDKGEFSAGKFNFNEGIERTAFFLFGRDIIEKMRSKFKNQKDITRAEEIASKRPDRKAKAVESDLKIGLSEEKQQELLLKKKKANAPKKSMLMR